MEVKILAKPPTSGTVAERQYSCSGDCLWVRFSFDEGDEWAGAFGTGNFPFQNFATFFAADAFALVVASGQGYVLRPQDGELIRNTAWDYVQCVQPIADSDLVVLADDTTIWVEDAYGEVWRSDRVALDGVIIDRARADLVEGKVWWSEGWYRFQLTPSPWTFTKLDFLTPDWHLFKRG